MKHQLFLANERGIKNTGWLLSNFTFSFSNYSNPMRSSFGTLIAFNDDFVQTEKGFGIHPHQNMEIISFMLQGNMSHKDDMGYESVVQEGSVQIMSAGSGLFHEEWNVGKEEVNFLQIWIQPKIQNVRPRYQTRHFPKHKRENILTTIVSNEEGLDHCWINQNTKLSVGYYTHKSTIPYSFNPTNKAIFLFVIEGSLMLNEEILLSRRDAVGVWDTNSFELNVAENTEFIIIETVVNQK